MCKSYIGKPIGTRTVPQFTRGLADGVEGGGVGGGWGDCEDHGSGSDSLERVNLNHWL